jgi:hypothetical protein
VDPASPDGSRFGAEDLDELLDDTRQWERVRGPGMLDPDDVLRRVVGGLFGARMDGPGGRFELTPFIPDGWKAFAIHGLRAHRTVMDVEVRPRSAWITIRLAVTFGPPLALALALAGDREVERVVVDDAALGAPRAIFTVRDEHEATFFLR